MQASLKEKEGGQKEGKENQGEGHRMEGKESALSYQLEHFFSLCKQVPGAFRWITVCGQFRPKRPPAGATCGTLTADSGMRPGQAFQGCPILGIPRPFLPGDQVSLELCLSVFLRSQTLCFILQIRSILLSFLGWQAQGWSSGSFSCGLHCASNTLSPEASVFKYREMLVYTPVAISSS